MSRLIKFQAYDCKTNEMITWDEINENDELGFVPFVDMLRTPERYKMRQFTGLHDRNGREIYEGDVCKYSHFVGIVKYSDGCFRITDGKHSAYFISTDCREIEVIGNIYENLELIGGRGCE